MDNEQSPGTAPKITPADIEANIAEEHFLVPGDVIPKDLPFGLGGHPSLGLLTICVLVLRNGFTVVGTSACASPENFNAAYGRKLARGKAVEQIWPLMGYELRSQLSRPALTDADAAADLAGTPRPDNPSTVES